MSFQPNSARQRSALAIVATLGILSFAFLYAQLAWTDRINDLGGDSSVYMLTAQYFSPYAAADEAARHFASISQYPPLYPLLIAFAGAAHDLLFAHLLTAGLLLAAVMLTGLWMRAEGIPAGVALAAAAAIGILPGILFHVAYLLAEPLFMALTAGALLLASRAEAEARPGPLYGAAALLAAAVLTRSAGVAGLGAFALYLALRRPPGSRAALAIALLPWIVWSLAGGSWKQGYMAFVREWLESRGETDWLFFFASQMKALWSGLAINLLGPGENPIGGSLLAAICLVSALARALMRKLDGLVVLATLMMLVAWPFPAERVRFMMPLAIVMIAQAAIVAHILAVFVSDRRVPPESRGQMRLALAAVVPALFAITFLANFLYMLSRFAEPLPTELAAMRRAPYWYENVSREQRLDALSLQFHVEEALRKLPDYVPSGECVYAPKAALVGFHGRRRTLALGVAPPGDRRLTSYFPGECRYAYFLPYRFTTSPTPLFPLALIRDQVTLLYAPHEIPADPRSVTVGVLVKLERDARYAAKPGLTIDPAP